MLYIAIWLLSPYGAAITTSSRCPVVPTETHEKQKRRYFDIWVWEQCNSTLLAPNWKLVGAALVGGLWGWDYGCTIWYRHLVRSFLRQRERTCSACAPLALQYTVLVAAPTSARRNAQVHANTHAAGQRRGEARNVCLNQRLLRGAKFRP